MPSQRLADQEMTFEEFKQYIEKEMFAWISKRKRSLGAHLWAVAGWAAMEYDRTNKIENPSTES